MVISDEHVRQAIAEQAAEWLVQNQAGGLDEAERAQFMGWLRASPVHVEEYLRMAAVSRDLGTAALELEVPMEELVAAARLGDEPAARHHDAARIGVPVARATARPRLAPRGWLIGGLASACALLLAVGLVWRGLTPALATAQRYATAHGERRSWLLADGSTLQLNTDSIALVRLARGERRVELAAGQAYFSVVHDARRPFHVMAAGADIVDVGTQFDVYRNGQMAVVTVAKGQVEVFAEGAPQPLARLAANERVSLLASTLQGAPSRVNLDTAESWRSGRIVFEQQPLGEVVAQFNRYASVPMEVADPALRALIISGAFDANDTDSFIAFLKASGDVVVERDAQRIRIARRAVPLRARPSQRH